MTYQNYSSDQSASTQYHQQLKPPSTPQITKNQQHPPLCQPWNADKWSYHFMEHSTDDLTTSDTPLLAADSDNDAEEEDFPVSALNDPV